MSSFGGGGSSGPTLQQQQLQAQQALTTANLNLEENAQRKSILNAMQGTRVFRGSALSRALAGNSNAPGAPQGGPSPTQINGYNQIIAPPTKSLLDLQSRGSGATPAGGAGAGGGSAPAGGIGGGARAGGFGPGK